MLVLIAFLRPPLRHFWIGILAWMAAAGAVQAATTVSVNDGFAPNPNGVINTIVLQPDGRILIGGFFTQLQPIGVNPFGANYIARLNHDGSPDTTFNPSANGSVNTIVVQPDGRILIGGSFTTLQPIGSASPITRNHIARLNADGSLDTTFDPNASGNIYTIALQANGQIIVGGSFTTLQPNGASATTKRGRIARVNADGTLDTTFDPEASAAVLALAIQPNGQIIVGGGFSTLQPNGALTPLNFEGICRLNSDGSLDASFGPDANGAINTVVLQPNGQILIGGGFTTLQPNGGASQQCDYFARLNTDGTLDTTFILNPLSNVSAIALQADGKLLLGGTFTSAYPINNTTASSVNYIARFNSDGSLDSSFNPNPNAPVNAIAVQPDGEILVGGYFSQMQPPSAGGGYYAQTTAALSTPRSCLARVASDGTLDATLAPDTLGRVIAAAVQSNGQIVIGGTFGSIGGVTRVYLARLNADGSLDTTFAPTVDGSVTSIAIQPNGQIVIGGNFLNVDGIVRNYLARLNTDGTLDGVFNPLPNGSVDALLIQTNGQIVIGGDFTTLTPDGSTIATDRGYLARVNSDGSLDSGFNPGANARIFALAQQANGQFIVGGNFTFITPQGAQVASGRNYVARINNDGTLDATSFNPNVNNVVYAIVIQSDGRIVIGGNFTALAPATADVATTATTATTRNNIARLNTDGTLDTTYDPGASSGVLSLALQSNGQIIVGGNFTSFAQNEATTGIVRNYVGRLNSDGSLDTTFNPSPNSEVSLATVLSNGNVLIAGTFTTLQPNGGAIVGANHLAIINSGGTLNTAFTVGAGGQSSGQVNSIAQQPDGRVVIGGSFTNVSGSAGGNIARFNPDGSADVSFVPNADGAVNSILMLPSGAATPAATSYGAWLNSNGTLRYALSSNANGQINAVAQLPNGQVLVGGLFTSLQGVGVGNIARINVDGTVDSTFNPNPDGQVLAIAVQPNGQIIIGGNFTIVDGITVGYIARVNTDGSLDTSFNPTANSQVNALAFQSNGQLIVGGSFNTFMPNGSQTVTTRYDIARLNADGTVDSGFNPNPNGAIQAISLLSNGQMIVGGNFTSFQPNGTGDNLPRYYVGRLNSDGTLDANFNPNPDGAVNALVVQASGQVILGGSFTTFQPNGTGNNLTTNYLARVNSDGTLDTNFNPNPNASVGSLTQAANGQIVVGGSFTVFQPNQGSTKITRNFLGRMNSDGSIDASFDPDPDGPVSVTDILADGSIVAGGSFTSVQAGGAMLVGGTFGNIGGSPARNLARLNLDGTDDGSFTSNPDGAVYAMLAVPDGHVLVGGNFDVVGLQARSNLARLNVDGSLDPTFNPGANAPVTAMALQANGSILVGGSFSTIAGQPRTNFARLSSGGAIDAAFICPVNGTINAIAVQTNGQIVIGGNFTSVGGQQRSNLARVNIDGSVDTTFNPGTSAAVNSINVQTDGTILVGGTFTSIGGQAFPYLGRLTSTGALDATFDPVPNGPIVSLTVQPDSKILLGGAFSTVGGIARYQFARLSASTAATQSISITPDGSTLTWNRGGGSPELSYVIFEESTDNVHWSLVGQGSRVGTTSAWQVSGATAPSNANFYVRTRGIIPATAYATSGLAETVQAFYLLAAPVLPSSSQVIGAVGSSLSYTIPATNLPTSYSSTPLPAGLNLNTTTGVISGTPTQVVTYVVTVTATNAGGTATGTLILTITSGTSFTAASTSLSNRLINLSTNTNLNGTQPLISGFVISGTGSKTVLLRAVGPGLTSFGVTNVVTDPLLQLYSSTGALLLQNSGWGGGTALSTVFTQVGAFPLLTTSADSAIVTTLAPGSYSIQASDPSGVGGSVLAEIYDASSSPLTATQRLSNLSSRGLVTSSNSVIAGFVISGSSTKSLLIRGVGPGLANYGVTTGALADPVLTVYNSSGTIVAQNFNWGTQIVASPSQPAVGSADLVAAALNGGAFALTAGSSDTALIANLSPGSYSVVVSSASNGTGIALAEVYELH